MTSRTPRTNIGRRLEILSCLLDHEASDGNGLGVVGVSERLGRQKSTISRGLRALSDDGLLSRNETTREFVVGSELLAFAAHAGDPILLRIARPVLEQVAIELGERAHLAVLQGAQVLTVDTVAGPAAIQASDWIGRLVPLHASASGHALACELDGRQLAAALGRDPLPAAGAAAPHTLAQLLKRLERVRTSGVAVADGELEREAMSVAAPVRDQTGGIVAAVSISGPHPRMAPRVERAGEVLALAARELADTLTIAG